MLLQKSGLIYLKVIPSGNSGRPWSAGITITALSVKLSVPSGKEKELSVGGELCRFRAQAPLISLSWGSLVHPIPSVCNNVQVQV